MMDQEFEIIKSSIFSRFENYIILHNKDIKKMILIIYTNLETNSAFE